MFDSSKGYELPSGRRVLSHTDVAHMAFNRAKTSELMDTVGRKFGPKIFAVMCKVPLGEIDEFIYKIYPSFTFTEGEHIMTNVQRLIDELNKLEDYHGH